MSFASFEEGGAEGGLATLGGDASPIKLPPRVFRVLAVCAYDNKTTVPELLSGNRKKNVTRARAQAINTLSRMGFSQPTIGAWLRIHHTSVNYRLNGRAKKILEQSYSCPIPDLSGEWAI